MIRKMYVLRTWMFELEQSQTLIEGRIQYPTKLRVYIAHLPFSYPNSTDTKSLIKFYKKNKMHKGQVTPQITTDKYRAMKFYTKKEALKLADYYGGCQVDSVWLVQKDYQDQVLNLYA